MNHKLLSRLVVFMLFYIAVFQLKAVQLSGAYTINPSLTASTTNFQNIRSAVIYLTSTSSRPDGGPANSGTVGVNGPVEFLISAGNFTEQVSIPVIPGSTPTNNIVFKGAGIGSTIFIFGSSDANNRHTLRLSGATNVTFRDMTISGNGTTHAWVVHIMGLNTNNNKFKNCQIDIIGIGQSSTSTNYIPFVINNSATAATTGTRIDGTEIDSCKIYAGYYSVVAAGAASNLHVGLKITNTEMRDGYLYGIYANYVNGITCDRNIIYTRSSYLYNYGIYLLNSTCTSPNRHIIANNKIHGFGYYGIYITSSNNLANNKGFIYNNLVGGGIKYEYSRCLWLNSSSQWAISHNSFNHDLPGYSNTYGAVYISGGTSISFRNNMCIEKSASPSLPLYATVASVFDTMNYNLFYRPDTSNGSLIFVGSNFNTGTFKGGAGYNFNSIYGNPEFGNDTSMINKNACFQGTPISYITNDINDTLRSSTNPTMGAIETRALSNNIAVLGITNISAPITTGSTDLNVLIRNNGDNTITSFSLTYTLNNGTPVTFPWTGSLGACDTVTVSFTGTQQVTLGNANNLKIYSSLPNLFADSDPSNDTIIASYYLPLSGIFNIGGPTPDFPNPTVAFDVIQGAGLAGPVRLVVHPGVYNGQISIDKPISNLSATNNIVMAGVNPSTCIIRNANANAGSRHVIRIGQSHIRIDSLTIQSASPTAGWGVHINKNNTKNIQVKNCIIEVTHPNGISSTSDLFGGVVMSGSNTSIYYYDTYVLDSIEVDSNIIRNGYFGVWQYSYFYNYYYTYGAPSLGISIRNNNISNVYYYGVGTNGTSSLDVSGNSVKMRLDPSTSKYDYGIYVSQQDVGTSSTRVVKINNNRIWNVNYMGLYFTNVKASASNRGQIYNNSVLVGYNLPSCYGIYISSLTNSNMYHNSVVNNQPGTSNSTGALTMYSATGMRMRNNHFVVSHPFTMGVPVYMSGSSFTSPAEFNYNNYYRPDTTGNFIYFNAWFSGTIFKGSSGNNVNSTVLDPKFFSDSLTTTFNGCMDAPAITDVPIDVLGIVRNTTLADIGACEVLGVSNDAGAIAILSPEPPVQPGNHDLRVRFVNYGTNIISSLDVGYRLNNGAPVTTSWFGSLNPCDTASVVFSGTNQITIAPGSVNTIKVFTSAPNSSTDSKTINDTINSILATPMHGAYIVGPAPSDFLNLPAAFDMLAIRGVDSVVELKVKTGTYSDQFSISPILGTSEQNKIIVTSLANHVDSVVITRNNSAAGNNYIVKLAGVKHIEFRRLTMNATNGSFGYVVEIMPNSGNATFNQCKLSALTTTTTSTNMSIVYGTNNTGGNFFFKNNTFTGGSYAIYLRGPSTTSLSDNIEIDSNTITNQYYMPIYTYYTSDLKIRNNNINSNSTYTSMYFIYAYYSDSALEITRNRIYTTTANGYGILNYYCDGTPTKTGLIANNIIRIGTGSSTTNFGIRTQYASHCLIANNTVVVSTTSTTGYAGYIYFNGTISNTVRIVNNVFHNQSTGNVLYHYNPTFGISRFNLIFGNGNGNKIQRGTPAANYTSLAAFRTAVPTAELYSIEYRHALISTTNIAPNVADTAAWALNGRGLNLAEVNVDYNGNPRPVAFSEGVNDIGAYQFTPTSLPPYCTAVPATPTSGATQAFLFAGDTVCKVVHDAFGTAPSYLTVRAYTGTRPPNTAPSDNACYMYIDADAPFGFYAFDMNLFYKDHWIGNNPNETDLKLAHLVPSSPWAIYSSTATVLDSVKNTLTVQLLNSYGVFTATDNNAPLPIELAKFEGHTSEQNAILLWQTSSEKNSSHFEIERSANNQEFKKVGMLQAAGNSQTIRPYLFQDLGAFNAGKAFYYRLKMVDKDGSFEHSKTILLSTQEIPSTITVGPNPFKNNFTLNNLNLNDEIEIIDINGKLIQTSVVKKEGSFKVNLENNNPSGIYFVKCKGASGLQIFKMIKE